MKVVIDVSSAIYGTGVSDYTINLVSHLNPKIVTPVGFSLRRQNDLKKLFPIIKVFPIPPTVLDLLWNKLHIIPSEIFTGPVDIFHSSDWTQPPSKAKKVTTVHDLSPFIYPQFTSKSIVETHSSRMRWAVKECDKFICVSESTANDLCRLFKVPEQKISLIYEALPQKLIKAPQKANYSDYILAIGSRQPRKNISRLIRAYKSHNFKQKLVITGENTLNSTDQNIIFTGFVSDQELVNLFAGADAFVYPTLYEGFGLPILAAFHYGIPVLASNTSSLPEVTGNAAILVDPTSESAIVTGIVEALRQKKYLIAAGKKQLQKYSWDIAASQTLALYKSLC